MVQVSELCRHVEVGSPKEFPNEVVPGLFDISRHTDVFRPLLLRIEFAFPSGLAQNSEAVLSLRVVGELEVEKRVLETVRRCHFGLRGEFYSVSAHVSRHDDLLRVHVGQHVRDGEVGVRHDELVEVDQHQVFERVHVSVKTVVQGRKQSFCPDFGLGLDFQVPR